MQDNFSTSGITPTGIGGSVSKSSSSSKETLLTTLTGEKVDINTAQNITLKGATIASIGGSYAENNLDNFSMDFSKDSSYSKTKTLSSIGEGTIQITDKDNSDTAMLNRDYNATKCQDSFLRVYLPTASHIPKQSVQLL